MKKISISLIFLIASSLTFTYNQLLDRNHQSGSSQQYPQKAGPQKPHNPQEENIANHALNGVSLAVAMANLPTVSSEYNHNISASYGTYADSHSFALGLSGNIINDRLSYKLSGAVNTKGNLAFGVGVGVNLGKKNQSNKELLDRIEKLENLVKQLQNK